VVRCFADEVSTQGNIESAARFVWEDVVEQVPFPGQGPGLEGLKDVLRGMRSAFPDLNFSIKEQIAEGTKSPAVLSGRVPISAHSSECPRRGVKFGLGHRH
jgi:predicted ester cyclase